MKESRDWTGSSVLEHVDPARSGKPPVLETDSIPEERKAEALNSNTGTWLLDLISAAGRNSLLIVFAFLGKQESERCSGV